MKGKCDRMKSEDVHLTSDNYDLKKTVRNILWQILCPDWKMQVEIFSRLLHIDTWNSHFVWDALISSSISCFYISSFCLKEISRLSSLWTLSAQHWIWKHSRCSNNATEWNRIIQIIIVAVVLCPLKNYREMRTRCQFSPSFGDYGLSSLFLIEPRTCNLWYCEVK